MKPPHAFLRDLKQAQHQIAPDLLRKISPNPDAKIYEIELGIQTEPASSQNPLCAFIRFERVDGIDVIGQRCQIIGGLFRIRQTQTGDEVVNRLCRSAYRSHRTTQIALFQQSGRTPQRARGRPGFPPVSRKILPPLPLLCDQGNPPFAKRPERGHVYLI